MMPSQLLHRLLHPPSFMATLAQKGSSLFAKSSEGRGIRTLDQGIKSPLLYR